MAGLVVVPRRESKLVVFVDISDSHADRSILKRHEKHLLAVASRGMAKVDGPAWCQPGDGPAELDRAFGVAVIYSPLFSVDFFADPRCCHRLKQAQQRSQAVKGLIIRASCLRPVAQCLIPTISVFPTNGECLGNRESAWKQLVTILHSDVENYPNYAQLAKKHQEPAEEPENQECSEAVPSPSEQAPQKSVVLTRKRSR